MMNAEPSRFSTCEFGGSFEMQDKGQIFEKTEIFSVKSVTHFRYDKAEPENTNQLKKKYVQNVKILPNVRANRLECRWNEILKYNFCNGYINERTWFGLDKSRWFV